MATLQVTHLIRGAQPNPPTAVSENGKGHSIFSTLSSDGSNLAVFPLIQAVWGGHPNASVSLRENRRNDGVGQTLFQRKRGHGIVPEAVQSFVRRNPNIALPVLKEVRNAIAGEAIRHRKHIGPPLMHMRKPSSAFNPHPQAPISISEESVDSEPRSDTWKRIRFDFVIREPFDSTIRANQEGSLGVLTYVVYAPTSTWQWIQFRRTWPQSPQPRRGSGPDVLSGVLIQSLYPSAQAPFLPVALDVVSPNAANLSKGQHISGHPNCSFFVFEESVHRQTGKFRV